MLPVGMNRYEINVKFLGLEIDKYIDWKTHIECFTQNEEMRAIWLDVSSIIALSKLLKWYIMRTFIQLWCMEYFFGVIR